MANDLTTTDQHTAPATASSLPALMASAKGVLDRAFDPTARFTQDEIALVERIAAATPTVQPVSDRTIRQSLGTLSGAMPAQATDEAAGKLKLGAYQTMLAGCDERALAHACRRCLADLDWFPTVHQLLGYVKGWVSPEQAAIGKARAILRTGRRAPEDADGAGEITADEVRQLRERTEAAAGALTRPRPQAVAYDTPALRPDQVRVPNRDDYQRLFGIDPEVERAKAERAAMAERAEETHALRDAFDMHVRLHQAA